jgi:hypothetical protein
VPRHWFYEENLRPVSEILASYARYEFDPSDWDAIEAGVRSTDSERGNLYDYTFFGRDTVKASFARDPGSSVVWIDWSAPPELDTRIQALVDIAAHWILTRER